MGLLAIVALVLLCCAMMYSQRAAAATCLRVGELDPVKWLCQTHVIKADHATTLPKTLIVPPAK